MQRAAITEETFVRDLPYNALSKLSETLDINQLWERLASIIPSKPENIFRACDESFEPRYTMAHITKLSVNGSSTRALIKDWSMQNCRIKHLVEALYQAKLNAAAAYLQKYVLHIEPKRSHSPTPNGNSVSESDNKVNINVRTHNVSEINYSLQSPSTNSERQVLTSHYETSPFDILATVSSRDSPFIYDSAGQNTNGLVAGAKGEKIFVEDAKKTTIEDAKDTHHLVFEDNVLKEIPFHILRTITNNFDTRNYRDGGNLIGEGGFGTVFIGTINTGYSVAVKCLKDSSDDSLEQFKTEVETLAKYKHENLVQLLGYSTVEDGPRCLVYEYMSNGSLEERLACRYDTEPLSNNIRLEITLGTARGIAFLHNGGLVHRDIKSANILLDTEFSPKVGDFATARVLPSGMASHIMKASVVIGTMAYLAPEALSFIIHPSLDSFSFGVVILEILTGLPVTDPNREEVDLKFHVQEHCCDSEEGEEPGTIFDLLDTRGGQWTKSIVEKLYSISCRCLEHARKKRPKMENILSELERLDQLSEIPKPQM